MKKRSASWRIGDRNKILHANGKKVYIEHDTGIPEGGKPGAPTIKLRFTAKRSQCS